MKNDAVFKDWNIQRSKDAMLLQIDFWKSLPKSQNTNVLSNWYGKIKKKLKHLKQFCKKNDVGICTLLDFKTQ